MAALGLLAAECLVVSWVQYFLFFLRAARGGTDGDSPGGEEAVGR